MMRPPYPSADHWSESEARADYLATFRHEPSDDELANFIAVAQRQHDEAERAALEAARHTELVEATREGSQASAWLTRSQAAKYLGVSLRKFDQDIRPHLPRYKVGVASTRFSRHDIDQWLDTRKVGGSEKKRAAKRTSFASESTAPVLNDPRAQAIRSRLRKRRNESTQTPSSEPPESSS